MSSQPTSTPDPLNENLKHAFPFTEDDLAANRVEKMTASQRERLSDKRLRTTNGFFAFLVFILAFGGCLVITNANESPNERSRPHKANNTEMAIILTLLGGGIALTLVFKSMSLGDDVRNNRAMSIKGPVERKMLSSKNGAHDYQIMSGKKGFDVSQPVYEAFVDHKKYILYYTAISETLIAAEHVPDRNQS